MIAKYNKEEAQILEVDIKGGKTIKGEFFNERIDPSSVPPGKKVAYLRHADDDDSTVAAISGKEIIVNLYGTFVTGDNIPGNEVEVEDWNFTED